MTAADSNALPASNGAGESNGVASPQPRMNDLRMQKPREVRSLLKLLKRKKARQNKSQKQLQAAVEAEREQLRKCVSLQSMNPQNAHMIGGRRHVRGGAAGAGGDAIAEEDEQTESEQGDEENEDAGGKPKKNSRAGGFASTEPGESSDDEDSDAPNVDIEYLVADETEGPNADLAREFFGEVFERFKPAEDEQEEEEEEEEEEESAKKGQDLTLEDEEDDDEDDKKEKGGKKLTKKQKKLMSRPSLAELKQKTSRPDMVEVWDTTSADPEFLVYLKGLRNTVAVPPHWSQKRRYLQWKRGFEKPPFKLPPHIEATKISEIRSALVEAESQKSLRQRMREKVRPKRNRLAIDYQVLHDCFFKHAVKPVLTGFGDLYYEGKEFEKKNLNFTPGQLSDRLKQALGMGPLAPSPWLINMQRYGPPPAYPRLKLPGLNAPIPAGCSYGYHAGGWGKPPVNEFGQPLFETPEEGDTEEEEREQVAGLLWGELPDAGEEDEEEEEDGEGKEGAQAGAPGGETPFIEGISSLGGVTSLASGLESPASSFDIRKRPEGTSSVASSTAKPYTILTPQEVPARQQQGQLFGVKHTYRIPSTLPGGGAGNAPGSATPTGHMTPRNLLSSGVATPSGVRTPFGGARTPLVGPGGSAAFGSAPGTPFVPGTASGAQTPARTTGFRTPAGVTVSLNPNEMEQEGVFTADVIRQQLRQHEEAAARAKQAAGQVDPTDTRKRKGDEIRGTQTVAKSKKKKQFKF